MGCGSGGCGSGGCGSGGCWFCAGPVLAVLVLCSVQVRCPELSARSTPLFPRTLGGGACAIAAGAGKVPGCSQQAGTVSPLPGNDPGRLTRAAGWTKQFLPYAIALLQGFKMCCSPTRAVHIFLPLDSACPQVGMHPTPRAAPAGRGSEPEPSLRAGGWMEKHRLE